MNKLKLIKFFHSNKNLTGIAFASLSLLLYLFGVIDFAWLPIVLSSYIFGYLVGPVEKKIIFYHFTGETLNDYIGFLNKLEKNSISQLPANSQSHLKNIITSSKELLLFLQNNKDMLSKFDENIVFIKEIFDKYLPELLNNYSKIPESFKSRQLHDGKTSNDLLLEQLKIIDEQIKHITTAIYENDVQKLQLNGEILKKYLKN